MSEREFLQHVFEPVWNAESKVLILGTFPSVKSRQNNFYYGHPKNRFWKVIAHLMDSPIPETIEQKKELLLCKHIAIWDVIASCSIEGSSDSSIRDVVPNDLTQILSEGNIKNIYANGAKAYELYMKYMYKSTKIDIIKLPSTSPANAVYTMDKLVKAWHVITEV